MDLIRPNMRVSAMVHPDNTASRQLIERFMPGCQSQRIKVAFAKSGSREKYTEPTPGMLKDLWTKKRIVLAEHLPRASPMRVARKLVELPSSPIESLPRDQFCPAAFFPWTELCVAFDCIYTNTSTELPYMCGHPWAVRVVVSLQHHSTGTAVLIRVDSRQADVTHRVFNVADGVASVQKLQLRGAKSSRLEPVHACVVEVDGEGSVLAHMHTTPFTIRKEAKDDGAAKAKKPRIATEARPQKAAEARGGKIRFHVVQPSTPERGSPTLNLSPSGVPMPPLGPGDSFNAGNYDGFNYQQSHLHAVVGDMLNATAEAAVLPSSVVAVPPPVTSTPAPTVATDVLLPAPL